MPTQRYGTTQVKEFRISEREAVAIMAENIRERADEKYDFDFNNPISFKDGDTFVLRFVQRHVTHETDERSVNFRPIPKS